MTRIKKEEGAETQEDIISANLEDIQPGSYQNVLDDPPWRRPRRSIPGHEVTTTTNAGGTRMEVKSGLNTSQGVSQNYEPQDKPLPRLREEDDEGCCMFCVKGIIVVLILTLIAGAVGLFGWNIIKQKFFPEEESHFPQDYDPYNEFQGFRDQMSPPSHGHMQAPSSVYSNPNPGKVHEVHSDDEMHDILTTRTGLVSMMFYQSNCGYCQNIDPVYTQLAAMFPHVSFLKINLEVVDMDGEITTVPTYYYICETIPVLTVQGPTAEELRKSTVDAIRLCGSNIGSRAMAMSSMPTDTSMGYNTPENAPNTMEQHLPPSQTYYRQ